MLPPIMTNAYYNRHQQPVYLASYIPPKDCAFDKLPEIEIKEFTSWAQRNNFMRDTPGACFANF
ncbi:MAG: hypothetical protein Q7K57_52355 [Burkholderiaceae bacterium]|nr:hypothetical protein [Burkholderiaceae bacterium]